MSRSTEIFESEPERIQELLLGQKVLKVADDVLRLSNGTLVRVVPNDGGCSCGAGNYELTELNCCDNVITSVEVVQEPRGPDRDGYAGEEAYRYSVFVLAEDKRINLFTVEGDDGNGYYGTGYRLVVEMLHETA